jgi:hypothetical protein
MRTYPQISQIAQIQNNLCESMESADKKGF